MKPLLLACLSLLVGTHGIAQIETTPFPGFKSLSVPKPGGGQDASEVTAELISGVTAIAPGKPFTVAWKFVHEEHWHSFWVSSGGLEKSPTVTWTLPDGFSAGPLLHSIPNVAELEGAASYRHEGISYLLTEITPPKVLAPGAEIVMEGAIKFQYCKEVCKQSALKQSLKLTGAAEVAPHPENATILAEYRKTQFPKPMPPTWQATATRQGSKIALKIQGSDLPEGTVQFYSADKHIVSKVNYNSQRGNGEITLTLPMDAKEEGVMTNLPGLVVFSAADPFAPKVAYEVNPVVTIGSGASSEVGGMTLSYTLLLAFLGGLILNLMPCVFPVIGLKIMGFVRQAGQDRKKILLHGLMFSAGVLVCFWALSGTLLFLRSRGEQVGWGFQLQSPWVVYGLMILMFAFALNMFGVFEIGTSAVGVGQDLTAKQGLSGTFFSGLLAVVVATPCSAPFLAPALGAALTLPPVSFFSVFSMVGVGLALPYLLLSAFPGLLKKLPKPGAWMEAFKQIMSFLLFMTAGYLLWVYGGLTAPTNEANQLYAVLGLGVIGLGAYVYGRWCTPVRAGKTRAIGGLLALGMVVGGIYMGSPKKDALKWEPWTQERVDELREQGVPVYIDFTAKWCATCQTNKLSYKSKEILRLVDEKKIVLLKADWTDDNPKITEALAGYGRSAIPVNVLYIPGQEEPEILPNLLTTDIVLGYWNKVPAPPAK